MLKSPERAEQRNVCIWHSFKEGSDGDRYLQAMAGSEPNFVLQMTPRRSLLLCGHSGLLSSVGSTHMNIFVKGVGVSPIP